MWHKMMILWLMILNNSFRFTAINVEQSLQGDF
jgi:hypothetical protein